MLGLLKEVWSLNVSLSIEVIAVILIFIGTVFAFLSAIGLIRLPDVYTRSHAASKSATLGVLCVLFGTLLYFWITQGIFSVRLLLGIFFVFLTAPVAAHVICRAAYRSNVELAEESVQDDLKKVMQEK